MTNNKRKFTEEIEEIKVKMFKIEVDLEIEKTKRLELELKYETEKTRMLNTHIDALYKYYNCSFINSTISPIYNNN